MTTDQGTFSVSDWLTGRLPADWFTAVEVTVDREEILIHGTIPAPETAGSPDAEAGRITRFREDTRGARIEIARELEARTGRKVAWGVTCGDDQPGVHATLRARHDPAAAAAAPGARHPRRGRRGPLALGRAGLVRPPGRPARG